MSPDGPLRPGFKKMCCLSSDWQLFVVEHDTVNTPCYYACAWHSVDYILREWQYCGQPNALLLSLHFDSVAVSVSPWHTKSTVPGTINSTSARIGHSFQWTILSYSGTFFFLEPYLDANTYDMNTYYTYFCFNDFAACFPSLARRVDMLIPQASFNMESLDAPRIPVVYGKVTVDVVADG